MVYYIPIMALSAVLMPLALLMQRNVDHDLDQNILNIMWVNLSFQLAISLMWQEWKYGFKKRKFIKVDIIHKFIKNNLQKMDR